MLWTLVVWNAAPLLRRRLGWRDGPLPYPVRLRLTLERLGTTYLKFGQFMAMRFDLLPMELCDELQRLFEHVPPMPTATARGVVERELGGPLSDFFSEFCPEPIGAASIAQVHAARTNDGARVAVKIQRPHIDRQFDADMRILGRIARGIDAMGWFAGLALHEMLAEFAGFTQRELDFMLEGQTAERLRRCATEAEVVPRIYWNMTTRRILTMEFIDGVSVAETARLLRQGEHAAITARLPNFAVDTALHNLAFASLHQFFATGFFHADPHPGNILLLADNKIAFVDFGIFGILSNEKREWLAGYTEQVAIGDVAGAYYYYAKLSTPTSRTDLAAFKRETRAVLVEWHEHSLRPIPTLRERHVAKVIGDITDIMRRHHVRLDLDTLLFWRAVIALDSSALSLSDHFDLIREMRLYFTRCRPSPLQRWVKTLTDIQHAEALGRSLSLAPRGWQAASENALGTAGSAVQTTSSPVDRDAAHAASRAAIMAVVCVATLSLALHLGHDALRIGILIIASSLAAHAALIVFTWQE